MLEYLLRHKGHVVSKTELLEHCWDVNFDGERPPGLPPVIQTVRGEGYIIRDQA